MGLGPVRNHCQTKEYTAHAGLPQRQHPHHHSGHLNDQALITSILTVGADRILFATDYPYDVATDAARWIESVPIAENDRRKIARGNAAKLLRLK